jgi:hypothetical protein
MWGAIIAMFFTGYFLLYFRAKKQINELEKELRGTVLLCEEYERFLTRQQIEDILDRIEQDSKTKE